MVDFCYDLALKALPSDVELVRLVALLYGGESASVPGCLCDDSGTLYGDMTITPLQFSGSAKVPVLQAFSLLMSIALARKYPSTVFMRRDFEGPRATTSVSINFLFSFMKLFNNTISVLLYACTLVRLLTHQIIQQLLTDVG